MVTRNYVVAQLSIALCAAVISNADARSASYGSAYSAAERNAQTGVASFYGDELQGRKTASGRRFDERAYTAASRNLPLNSKAQVTSLKTGLSVTVTITDRGPYKKTRLIDLSKAAAEQIGITTEAGIGLVVVKPVRKVSFGGLPPQQSNTRL